MADTDDYPKIIDDNREVTRPLHKLYRWLKESGNILGKFSEYPGIVGKFPRIIIMNGVLDA